MTNEALLLRQINPIWVQEGHVTSQAFRPTPKDRHQLSVYDGDLITAEAAWEHFTQSLHLKSSGVLAVSVEECMEKLLSVFSDPNPFPEHVIIDFSELTENQRIKVSKKLRVEAEARGWLYHRA